MNRSSPSAPKVGTNRSGIPEGKREAIDEKSGWFGFDKDGSDAGSETSSHAPAAGVTGKAAEADTGNKRLVSTWSDFDDDAGSEDSGWFVAGSDGSETSIIRPEKSHLLVSDKVASWLMRVAQARASNSHAGSSEEPTAGAIPGTGAVSSEEPKLVGKVEYPEELTARYWQSSYGRPIGNFDGEAEMEARMEVALKGLERAHAGIDWKKLAMSMPDPFTAEAWQATLNAATDECFKLDEVRVWVLKVGEFADEFLRSGPRSQIMVDRVRAIQDRLKEPLESYDVDAWRAQIGRIYDNRQQEVLDTLNTLNHGIPDRVAKALALVRQARNDDDWDRLRIQQKIHDITVALAPAELLRDGGFDVEVDVNRCQKWHDNLRAYGEKTRLSSISSEPFQDHQRRLAGMLARLQQEGVKEFIAPAVPAKDARALPQIPTKPQQTPIPQPPVASPEWKEAQNRVKYLGEQVFPGELEVDHWQQRSKRAKTWVHNTGLGTALRELKTAYGQIPWDNLKMPVPDPFTRLEWLRMREAADAACHQVDAVHAQALQVRRIAGETLKKFRSNVTIPKSDGDRVELIEQKANEILVSCDGNYLRSAIRLRHKVILLEKSQASEAIDPELQRIAEISATEKKKTTTSTTNLKATIPQKLVTALTPTNWVAKSYGIADADVSGIKGELETLERLFDQCEWFFKIYIPDPYTIESWYDACNAALEQCGKMEMLRAQAVAVQGRVNKVRQDPRFGTLRSLCDAVIAAATALIQSCDLERKREDIKGAYKGRLDREAATPQFIKKGIYGYVGNCLWCLKEVQVEDDWNKKGVPKSVRDMTVHLANAYPVYLAGHDISRQDVENCIRFNSLLNVYGRNETISALDEKNAGGGQGMAHHRRFLEQTLNDLYRAFQR